ncbi:START-like domain-containing protein [Siphonobacter curvatus]|uniref:ATPase n=1 Tax=Siphonobacter curvatus TaxID=2094562 RepID=A0A2S7IQ45_9BACT|nr:START-like domain-containing protein [Siphonobacter curvatus]PQA59796.1 ATPase [Siphonobacter curvatus]
MTKHKFVTEYELRASPKMLFPYVSTASGLQQWFANKVNVGSNQSMIFEWDGENHPAKIVSMRQNKSIKYDFTPDANEEEHNYMEFRLDQSDLTNSTFLKITDYSDNTDEEDLRALWDGLIDTLREVVGG